MEPRKIWLFMSYENSKCTPTSDGKKIFQQSYFELQNITDNHMTMFQFYQSVYSWRLSGIFFFLNENFDFIIFILFGNIIIFLFHQTTLYFLSFFKLKSMLYYKNKQ